MSRSKWKGPNYNVEISNINKLDKPSITIMPRHREITPNLKGLNFKIHNGKEYQELIVTEEMIGHKFGEFVFTRGKFSFKKKIKKKN